MDIIYYKKKNIYKYKPGVSYPIRKGKDYSIDGYPLRVRDLPKHRMCVTSKKFFDIEFSNVQYYRYPLLGCH